MKQYKSPTLLSYAGHYEKHVAQSATNGAQKMLHVICKTIPEGLTLNNAVIFDGELHFLADDSFECPEAAYISKMDKQGKVEVLKADQGYELKHVFSGWDVPVLANG